MKGSTSSITTASSAAGTIPNFEEIQKTYTKRITLGRHPRSFPRQSEMWHHTVNANERLSRIGSGHHLWNVVEESKQQHDVALSMLGSVKEDESVVDENIIVPTGSLPTTEKKKQVESLNGIAIDMKSKVRLHFGMSFFIMNSMDEILCVNKWDEILCKSQNKLDSTDRITFKLIDLEDPTNPGAVKYGRSMWLQVIDNSVDADNSMQGGYVVGSQLFGPPQMGSVQKINNTKGHATAAVPANAHKKQNAPLVKEKSVAVSESGDSIPSSVPSDENISAPISPSNRSRKTSVDTDDEDIVRKESPKKPSRIEKEQIEICGGLKTVKITGVAKDSDAAKDTGAGAGTPGVAHYKGYRNRNAWHLGQWVCRSAIRDQRNVDVYVNALSPIFMEQDLYCLASSMGSAYDSWPKRAQDPRLLKMSANDDDEEDVETSRTGTLKKSLEIAASDAENFDRGCLRRVVMRGLPYEHIVDRRCVWKFCIADSAGDLKLLSAKEQIAQKIMRTARTVLEKSKHNRMGRTRRYDGSYKDKQLVGGEMFPRLLREITSEFTLSQEASQMAEIRNNEDNLVEHFSELFHDIDVHKKRKSRTSSCRSSRKDRSGTIRGSSSMGSLGTTSMSDMGAGGDPYFTTTSSIDNSYDGASAFLTGGGDTGSVVSAVSAGSSARRGSTRLPKSAAKLQPVFSPNNSTSGVSMGTTRNSVRFQDTSTAPPPTNSGISGAIRDAIKNNQAAAREYRIKRLGEETVASIEKVLVPKASDESLSSARLSDDGAGSPRTTSTGTQKKKHINPLRAYGAAMSELHSTFSVVNSKITVSVVFICVYMVITTKGWFVISVCSCRIIIFRWVTTEAPGAMTHRQEGRWRLLETVLAML